jgi:hypothetical protein
LIFVDDDIAPSGEQQLAIGSPGDVELERWRIAKPLLNFKSDNAGTNISWPYLQSNLRSLFDLVVLPSLSGTETTELGRMY